MKTRFIAFGLLFLTFVGCCNTYKKDLKETKRVLKIYQDTLNDIRSLQKLVLPVPDDVGDQTSIEADNIPNDLAKNTFPVTGNIDIEADEINLKIYVPENKLKIVNYVNISTNKTNAILVVLDGNNGKKVGDGSPSLTKIIKKKIKISKTGFNKDLLEEHNSLAVIVLHDDNFNGTHVVGYQREIIKYPNYTDFDKFLMRNWKAEPARPDEDGGNIIP